MDSLSDAGTRALTPHTLAESHGCVMFQMINAQKVYTQSVISNPALITYSLLYRKR